MFKCLAYNMQLVNSACNPLVCSHYLIAAIRYIATTTHHNTCMCYRARACVSYTTMPVALPIELAALHRDKIYKVVAIITTSIHAYR